MHPQGAQFFDESQQRSFDKGRATTIIEVLEARGLLISDDQRERILSCSDLAMLREWTRKVATVASTDELFA
ncbi:MAG TPA: hypothetical protein VI072_30045 [Polyangiaceae bacterium]